MTLEEYKRQVKEITEASQNFNGTPEEAVKFFEDLAQKYPQVNEFNTKAMDCKDLKEFENLADAFGMKFSSDDSAEKLFFMLQDGKKAIMSIQNVTKLSDEDKKAVAGGVPMLDTVRSMLAGVGVGYIVGLIEQGGVSLFDKGQILPFMYAVCGLGLERLGSSIAGALKSSTEDSSGMDNQKSNVVNKKYKRRKISETEI